MEACEKLNATTPLHVIADLGYGDEGVAGKTSPVMPSEKTRRDDIRRFAAEYVAREGISPPPSKGEVWRHARRLIELGEFSDDLLGLAKVLIHNEIWKDTVASVPFERRLLLLPQCLRSTERCQAEIDEFGLLCERCGACPIGEIQTEAEELGYVVLIAEGTTVVTSLLESGKVDALIGVSCLAALEKTFPHMSAHAIPGVAVPLNRDGCVDTTIDRDWLEEALRLKTEQSWIGRMELRCWHQEVDTWFDPIVLKRFLADSDTETQQLAIAWLSKHGKRWRPLLLMIAYKALAGSDEPVPDGVKKLAVAVECFHKASLIHDDIEDEDDYRYGEATLHRSHGIAVALNIGDLLLGEGYRLIADCGADSAVIASMLACAADGHHTLCLGQGEELNCLNAKSIPSTEKILEIFRCKTSPAFHVALCLGAYYAGNDDEICGVLRKFSESLGVAYQIQDDIDDFNHALESGDSKSVYSSLLLAMALENSDHSDDEWALILAENGESPTLDALRVIAASGVEENAKQLGEYYKNEAVRSLTPLRSAPLKSLLRTVVGRIVGKKQGKKTPH